MIELACTIPKKVVLACSGGKDSMAALCFLLNGRREISIAHFNHGTPHSQKAESFVKEVGESYGLRVYNGYFENHFLNKAPTEADWRDQRYEFFKTFNTPVITAHHLDDSAEWWLFTSLKGSPKTIPVTRNNPRVIRPFIKTKKAEFHRVANPQRWIEDPSNNNTNHARNRIRHNVMPEILKINPGFLTNVRNQYRA